MKCEAINTEKPRGGACQRPAALRRVSGKLMSCTSALCDRHAGIFKRQGYEVTTVDEKNG